MSIAEIVYQARSAHHLTLAEMAAKLECSIAYICMIENGSRIPGALWVRRFAEWSGEDEDVLQALCGRATDKVKRLVETHRDRDD